MTEYIEREALVEVAEQEGHISIDDILEIPAADVAPVVRCVECKYAYHCPNGYIYCQRDGRNAYEMVFKKGDFCSYGERKEG